VDRLGIGWTQLSAVNPRIVYLSISGFGQTGPRAGQRAYDPIIQLYSGVAAVQGRIHAEHPQRPEQVNQLILDKLTAYTGCQAITAALLARTQTGRGQHIELSMLDTAIAFLWADTAADLILQGDGVEARPPVGASGTVLEYADGFAATMTLTDDEFTGMCEAFGVEHIHTDPRFSSVDARMHNREALRDVLQTELSRAAKSLTLAEAERRMTEHDVPFARARRLPELHDDTQVKHNAMFRDLDHPIAGPLRDARPAPLFRGTPAAPAGPAPTVGQHTREIMREIGLEDRLEAYLARGILTA
jgi:crotonobetainyl-CoA:carnitine CoA-transferase CaiB-like acyl-CoA transferase